MAVCQISGIVLNGEGEAAANISLRFTPLSITGVAMSVATVHAKTNAAGQIQDVNSINSYVELIQGGTYRLNGPILGGYNDATGENIQIPTEATADFSDLISVEAIPSEGLTVQSNGTPLPTLIGTFNIVGATVEQTSAGVARLTFVGSGLADGDKGDITVSGGVWTIDAGAINNAKVAAGAAIAYSKLALTGAILNADLAGGIAQSKITDLVTDLAAKATTGYVDAAIANLVDSSPGTLDTLNELAAALGDDPNFATTITTLIGTKLAKASNLSDLTDASAARTNLGLVIGTNVQAHSGDLAAIAALTPSNDDILQRKAGAWTNRTIAQYKTDLALVKADVGLGNVLNSVQLVAANNLSDLANAGTARTNLGVAIGSDVQAFNANLTTFSGIAPSANVQTLLGAANFSAFRTSLGVAIGSDVQAWDADLDAWATKTAPGGTVVGTTDAQTLTNKTLTSPVINLGSDATGDIYYRNSGGAFTRLPVGTNGHVLTLASGLPSWAAAAGGGSQTPWTANVDADGFSLLVDDGTGIFSSESGNPELLKFTSVASAVNEVTLTNAATGNNPALSATGDDTNISMAYTTKGTGAHIFAPGSGNVYGLIVRAAGSSTNSISIGDKGFGAGGAIAFGTSPNILIEQGNGIYLGNAQSIFFSNDAGIFGNNGFALVRSASASLRAHGSDATTNTITNTLILGHNTSGTAAAGFGSGVKFQLQSSTTADQDAAQIAAEWTTATHASRTADLVFKTVNNAAALAEAFRLKGDLSAVFAGIPRFNGPNSTGAGSALLGSNCPASTLTAPAGWIHAIMPSGVTGYIPIWV